jgi:hypothetical protein
VSRVVVQMVSRDRGASRLCLRSATRSALRARSALMRWARSCCRVRRRVGIMAPRSPGGRRYAAGTVGNSPVGRHRAGNSRRVPGRVTYLCPVGEVQVTVPSGSCSSRHAVQKVLSRWCYRLAKEHSSGEWPTARTDGPPPVSCAAASGMGRFADGPGRPRETHRRLGTPAR